MADDEVVRLAARAMFLADRADTLRPGKAEQWWDNGDAGPEIEEPYLRRARALREAGLLATFEEWGISSRYELEEDDGPSSWWSTPWCDDPEKEARKAAEKEPGVDLFFRRTAPWVKVDR